MKQTKCFKLFIEHSGMSYLSKVLPKNKYASKMCVCWPNSALFIERESFQRQLLEMQVSYFILSTVLLFNKAAGAN